MSIRREPTYLSTEVFKACLLLAKFRTDDVHNMTADEVADTILRDAIEDQWPQVFEFQKQVAKQERELIKQLGGKE